MTTVLIEHPVITRIERTGWPEGMEPSEGPVCPVCGRECEDVYLDRLGDIVGCDGCLTRRDAWDVAECTEGGAV